MLERTRKARRPLTAIGGTSLRATAASVGDFSRSLPVSRTVGIYASVAASTRTNKAQFLEVRAQPVADFACEHGWDGFRGRLEGHNNPFVS